MKEAATRGALEQEGRFVEWPAYCVRRGRRIGSGGNREVLAVMRICLTTFHSAEAFLQSNEIEDTCCLITDVRLPGMSGFQLKIELERNGFDVPTIFVTAYPGELIPASAQGVRPACVLTKPVREMELLARIDEVRDRPPE